MLFCPELSLGLTQDHTQVTTLISKNKVTFISRCWHSLVTIPSQARDPDDVVLEVVGICCIMTLSSCLVIIIMQSQVAMNIWWGYNLHTLCRLPHSMNKILSVRQTCHWWETINTGSSVMWHWGPPKMGTLYSQKNGDPGVNFYLIHPFWT